MTAFDTCYASVIKSEGGFVHDPRDNGGATNWGVTQRAWEVWLGRPVTEDDMRALTVDQVKPFYRSQYWNAAHCDALPTGLALVVFHCAVNAGVGRAAKLLQRVVGAVPDGAIGPATLRSVAVWTASNGERVAIHAFQEALRAFYHGLPTFPTFGKGWFNRAADVEQQAMGLAT